MTRAKKITFRILFIYIVSVMVFAVFFLSSCESKSGRIAKLPLEKVIIVDSYPKDNETALYHYKVKRVSHGVVDEIFDYGLYEHGDTIYHKFSNI